jgi:hypothetical protein
VEVIIIKVHVALNPRSKTMIELSNKLINGRTTIPVWDEGEQPNLEYLRSVMVNTISVMLYDAPLNDFMFSSLDEEGNINGAL